MLKNELTTDIQKWVDECGQGKHQGLIPTPAHENSIWDTDFIPERYASIEKALIESQARRLGITIPHALMEQLLIQNGGELDECVQDLFNNATINWTNATVDGIETIDSWEHGDECNWFDSVEGIQDKNLLIIIASHSESQLCLDYRKNGPSGVPSVAYIDVSMNPIEVLIIADTVDYFFRSIVAAR